MSADRMLDLVGLVGGKFTLTCNWNVTPPSITHVGSKPQTQAGPMAAASGNHRPFRVPLSRYRDPKMSFKALSGVAPLVGHHPAN